MSYENNYGLLKLAAELLGNLSKDLVFVGGSTTCLYVDPEMSDDLRPTEDVDCVIQAYSMKEYNKLEKELRAKGFGAAQEFQVTLNDTCRKLAEAPLQNSSEWGNPNRRAFFECKGQYTLIFVYSPYDAKTNQEVQKIIFADIYPSASKQGNTPRPEETIFNADELLKE